MQTRLQGLRGTSATVMVALEYNPTALGASLFGGVHVPHFVPPSLPVDSESLGCGQDLSAGHAALFLGLWNKTTPPPLQHLSLRPQGPCMPFPTWGNPLAPHPPG